MHNGKTYWWCFMLPIVFFKIIACLVILNSSFFNLLLLFIGLFALFSHLWGFFLILVSSFLAINSKLDFPCFILCNSISDLRIDHVSISAVLWKLKGSMAKQMLKKGMSVRSSLRTNVADVLVVYLGNTVLGLRAFWLVTLAELIRRNELTAVSALSLIKYLLIIYPLD